MHNNIRKAGLIFFLFTGVLFSCSHSNEKKMDSLYAINGLLNDQSSYLTRKAAKLTKVSRLGERSDTVVVVPDSFGMWKEELEIFSVIDAVNKPANRTLYKVETLPDDKSNLTVKSFTSTENSPLLFLKFFYQETEDKIRKVEAKYSESNILYNSTRHLTMEFQPIDDTVVLISYEILGDQKMFLSDSVKYIIRGAVSLPD